jgi:hypothetical protein
MGIIAKHGFHIHANGITTLSGNITQSKEHFAWTDSDKSTKAHVQMSEYICIVVPSTL